MSDAARPSSVASAGRAMSADALPAVLARLVRARRVLLIGRIAPGVAVHAATAISSTAAASAGVARTESVVVLTAPDQAGEIVQVVDASGHGNVVRVVAGEPRETVASLRTDDDTTFDVVSIDVTDTDAADATQFVEWALVLGRPGTAIVVSGSSVPARTRTALSGFVGGHPRIDAGGWDTDDSVLLVAVTTD